MREFICFDITICLLLPTSIVIGFSLMVEAVNIKLGSISNIKNKKEASKKIKSTMFKKLYLSVYEKLNLKINRLRILICCIVYTMVWYLVLTNNFRNTMYVSILLSVVLGIGFGIGKLLDTYNMVKFLGQALNNGKSLENINDTIHTKCNAVNNSLDKKDWDIHTIKEQCIDLIKSINLSRYE